MDRSLLIAVRAYQQAGASGDPLARDDAKRQLATALRQRTNDRLYTDVHKETDAALRHLRFALVVACAKALKRRH
jgi:hypothetical protein